MSREEFITELGLRHVKNWLFGTAGTAIIGLGSYFGVQFLDHGEKNRQAIIKASEKNTQVELSLNKLIISIDGNTEIQKLKIENINSRIDGLEKDVDIIDKKLDKIRDKL